MTILPSIATSLRKNTTNGCSCHAMMIPILCLTGGATRNSHITPIDHSPYQPWLTSVYCLRTTAAWAMSAAILRASLRANMTLGRETFATAHLDRDQRPLVWLRAFNLATTMKPVLFILSFFAAVGGLAASAEAQNYPWCAQYGGGMGGAMNCGFTTFQQCQATVSGVGGFCIQNSTYQPTRRSGRGRYPY